MDSTHPQSPTARLPGTTSSNTTSSIHITANRNYNRTSSTATTTTTTRTASVVSPAHAQVGTRAERIARYKEERRLQLASQCASRVSPNVTATSGTPASPNGGVVQYESLSCGSGGGITRSTRASRLRAAATAAAGKSAAAHTSENDRRSEMLSKEAVSSLVAMGVTSPRPCLEKDKTAKRKSNLNRATKASGCDELSSSDTNDEKCRRRARRFFPPEVLSSTAASPSYHQHQDDTPVEGGGSCSLSSLTASAIFTDSCNSSSSGALTPPSASSLHYVQQHNKSPPPTTSQPSSFLASVPQASPISPVSSNSSASVRMSRRSELSIHMENARRSVTAAARVRQQPSSPRCSTVDDRKPQQQPRVSVGKRMDDLMAMTLATVAKVESLERKQHQQDSETHTRRLPGGSGKLTNALLAQQVGAAGTSTTPVSILKRKVSQEEQQKTALQTPPVTFSPNVVDPPVSSTKRQGILKKRRSLDESQVMRHRSCSPDKSCESRGGASILKHQRRSSLEEITRAKSPTHDAIQGILKRKTSTSSRSNDDDFEVGSLNSPQGILKRRSGASSAGSTGRDAPHHTPHVSIATAVILAAADGAEMILDSDHVKPILKKKSFSEDYSSQENVHDSSLKPILKKKSSTDTDDGAGGDGDQRPKRPILKLRSTDSGEQYDVLTRMSINYDSGSECDVRPILKASTSTSGGSSSGGGSSSSAVSASSSTVDKPRLSFCHDDDIIMALAASTGNDDEDGSGSVESGGRVSNRRSLTDLNFDERKRRVEKEMDRELQKPRVLSVFELVKSFEATGAVPKKSSMKRHSDRYRTQPITVDEIQATRRLSFSNNPTAIRPGGPSGCPPPSAASGTGCQSLVDLSDFPHRQRNRDHHNMASSTSACTSTGHGGGTSAPPTCTSSSVAADGLPRPEGGTTAGSTSSTTVMSSDSAFQSLGDGLELEEPENENSSSSSSSSSGTNDTGNNACMNLAMQMRAVAAEARKLRKMEAGSNGIAGNVEKRFSTQPVTSAEVSEAARLNDTHNSPEKLSVLEKIKLLKARTEAEPPKERLVPPRRSARFSTQPITIDEMSLAVKSPSHILGMQKTSSQVSVVVTEPKLGQHEDEGISSNESGNSDSEQCESTSCVYAMCSPVIVPKKVLGPPGGMANLIAMEAMAAIRKRREGALPKSKSHAAITSEQPLLHHSNNNSHHIPSSESASPRTPSRGSTAHASSTLLQRSVTSAVVGVSGEYAYSNSSTEDDTDAAAMIHRNIGELQRQLQQSGDSEWLKRRNKLNTASQELLLLQAKNLINDEFNDKQQQNVLSTPNNAASILAAKKDELDASSRRWRSRVEKSDAENFTVAGKMPIAQQQQTVINIPMPDKRKRTPRPKRFKGKQDIDLDTSSTPASPDLDKNLVLTRSASSTEDNSSTTALESSYSRTPTRHVKLRTVEIHRPDDDEFNNFYKSSTTSTTTATDERVDLGDLDCVKRSSESLLVQRKNIQVTKRRLGTSRNPVKSLAQRTDLQTVYTEISTGFADREMRRMNTEKLKSATSNFAVEALAGLASTEDFSSVVLKSSASGPIAQHLPFKSLMLLQIKGRKHVQVRLVEPTFSSINLGDNYLLVTPSALYLFNGTYANVIEQSRAVDVANHVQQRADLGCKVSRVKTLDPTVPGADLDEFWTLLGGKTGEITSAGHPDEDDAYETSITQTNMVYRLEQDELVPCEEYWGVTPKVELLQETRCLVFDFGSEMYVWSGKVANKDEKKTMLRLAQQLWETGYNYTECGLCPLTVSYRLGARSNCEDVLKAERRPEWAMFAKLTQNRETILFREKFADWPDYTRVIKVRDTKRNSSSDCGVAIKPVVLPEHKFIAPDFIVENTNLGRGRKFFDEENRWHFDIATLNVTCWNILENTYEKLDEQEVGQFYEGDTYIIRWKFRVTVQGRELSGKPSKHLMLGRDRCAYFNWFGHKASTNEKGTAALLTVELDNENAKQFRIVQEHEPPAFLQLFKGRMVIHHGKRAVTSTDDRKLFMVRGDTEDEAFLLQVPLSKDSLRSRSSFILRSGGETSIYHGTKSSETTKNIAWKIAGSDAKLLPSEPSFLTLGTFTPCTINYPVTARMFHFSSVSGQFSANEILNPHRCDTEVSAYPFLQHDLYSENQPALFLIDAGESLWLWQGWWPQDKDRSTDNSDEDDSSSFGSSSGDISSSSERVRWHAERRAAMNSAVVYWNSTRGDGSAISAQLVWAGLEPLSFRVLFPTWQQREDVRSLNLREDNKQDNVVVPLVEELALLSRDRFEIAELQQRPLPMGVDPTHLERYLSDEDFQKLFAVARDEFATMPAWKQRNLKKDHGLF